MSGPIFHSLAEAAGQFGPCALAIGNFDGVHVGHQALVRAASTYAAAHNLVSAVLTFHPHPSAVVAPERTPEMLCTLEQRISLLLAAGAERVLVAPFTTAISRLTAAEFVRKFVVAGLDAKAVFVGENFRFGHQQSGDAVSLAELARQFGFHTDFLAPVVVRGQVVSSSLIRATVRAGNVSRSCRLLGRPFSIRGAVVPGQGIGARQTVPTLNLQPTPGLVLPRGVFITETIAVNGSGRWPSITNIGTRPTFLGHDVTIETFLLRPLAGESPGNIEVRFRRFVRPERRFENPAELRAQILRDVARAQEFWRKLDILGF